MSRKFCTGFVQKLASRGLHRRVILREVPQGSAQPLVKAPYFIGFFGDPDWIRTSNLPLRRGLLYPVEPRDHMRQKPYYTLGSKAVFWKQLLNSHLGIT